MVLEKLKRSFKNLSIEVAGDAIANAVSLVIGYFFKVFFLK
ncbi:hypothetical protein [Neobacillus endophyticus]|nr:hypothetical protein [Neobacillus endophyticus]